MSEQHLSLLALTCDELVVDFEVTAERWRTFFAAHPAALAVPCDIAGSSNVAELIWHIFTASIRLSQRLLDEPMSTFDQGRITELDALMSLEQQAAGNLRRFLAAASQEHLDAMIEFKFRSGTVIPCSRRKLFLHVAIHAIRHWAQIGTLVRQHGFRPDWPQDFLYSAALH